jgi:hypothetical protein
MPALLGGPRVLELGTWVPHVRAWWAQPARVWTLHVRACGPLMSELGGSARPTWVLGCIPVGPTCRLGPTRYQGRSQDLTIGGAKRQCQLKIYEHNFLVVDIVIGTNKHLFIKCRSSTFTTRHIEHVN